MNYSWATMAHIPWPEFFFFYDQVAIGLAVLFRYMIMKPSEIRKILLIVILMGHLQLQKDIQELIHC